MIFIFSPIYFGLVLRLFEQFANQLFSSKNSRGFNER